MSQMDTHFYGVLSMELPDLEEKKKEKRANQVSMNKSNGNHSSFLVCAESSDIYGGKKESGSV